MKTKTRKPPTHTCDGCKSGGAGKKARGGGLAIPPGWKNHQGKLLCKKCLQQRFVLRAMELPVVGVVEGGTWEEFVTALRDAFRMSTDLYNWAMRQLLVRDFQRTPGMSKIPAWEPVDLYKLYNQEGCPVGNVATSTRVCVFDQARKDYVGRRRVPALWLGTENLPLKRYPAPFPVHVGGWKAEWRQIDGKRTPCVSLRLHSGEDGPRWVLRLACGRPHRRQLLDFVRILRNDAIVGQLELYERGCGQTQRNCPTSATKRAPGGASRKHRRLMLKFVGRFPRSERTDCSGVLVLRTDPNAFLVAEHDGRAVRPWILNHDDVTRRDQEMRAMHQKHKDWLQRLREDMKLERRTHAGSRQQILDCFQRRCDKHARRMKTWIDQTVAQVVGYCRRRRIAAVLYDDGIRTWCEQFPWAHLRTTLRTRCERDGIAPGGTLLAPDDPDQDSTGPQEGEE